MDVTNTFLVRPVARLMHTVFRGKAEAMTEFAATMTKLAGCLATVGTMGISTIGIAAGTAITITNLAHVHNENAQRGLLFAAFVVLPVTLMTAPLFKNDQSLIDVWGKNIFDPMKNAIERGSQRVEARIQDIRYGL